MLRSLFVLACIFSAVTCWNASAASVHILSGNRLYTVPLTGEATLNATSFVTITGVDVSETLVGIDVRPQTQRLYALGVNAVTNTATLYHVSPETGFAAAVGNVGSVAFTTDGVTPVDFPDPAVVGWGFDFNPAADRVRVVVGSLNFRINPNTGGPVDGDNTGLTTGNVTGNNPDGVINTGTTTVDAAAYTNNQPNNGGITTLYTLDGASNSLFVQNAPNVGTQTLGVTVTLGGTTLDFSSANGFDIAPGVNAPSSNSPVTSGVALAVLNVGGVSSIYSINLVNGQATLIGNLPPFACQGFCIRTELSPVIALSADGTNLLRFSTSTPSTVNTQAANLSSLVAGEMLVGLDWRPQTGQFYALGIDAIANTGTLYLVDPQTGAVSLAVTGTSSAITFAGVDFPDPATSGYGIDFNPTVDRLRVTTSTGLNFRVNPNTGLPTAATVDGPINGSGSAGVAAVAYTRSFTQSLTGGTTDLYSIDAAQDTLFVQSPANSGTQTTPLLLTLNGSALNVTETLAFDIPPSIGVGAITAPRTGAIPAEGWIAGTVGGVTGLYRLNLETGVASSVGSIGVGNTPLIGLTVFTTPSLAVEAPTGTTVSDGNGLIAFGTTPFGTNVTRTVKIKNSGSQILQYSASATGLFAVTQNAVGTVNPASEVTLTLTLTASTVGAPTGTLTILNSDAAFTSFDVTLNAVVTAIAPTITTPTSAEITTTTATLGANVTSNGGAALSERGVVFAKTADNADPLINGTSVTKVVATGTATGVFTTPVANLAPGVAYSFKAYATNSVSTVYTTVATFTAVNNAPVISSGPSATPSTASVGQTVAFAVAATDADGHDISYSWSVNGVTLSGAAPTYIFTAAGTYTATVTASDAFGGSVSASVTVTVNAPVVGVGNDTDGDGFSDDFETVVGTNPNSATDSPNGGVTPVKDELDQQKLAIKLNFAKPNFDALSFAGTLDIPADFTFANKTVVVDVGGVIRSVTFTADGKLPAKSTTQVKGAIKSKKGVVLAQNIKYSVKLLKGSFATALADEGLVNADVKDATVSVLVRVVFAGVISEDTQQLKYSAKAGKTGSAKSVK